MRDTGGGGGGDAAGSPVKIDFISAIEKQIAVIPNFNLCVCVRRVVFRQPFRSNYFVLRLVQVQVRTNSNDNVEDINKEN